MRHVAYERTETRRLRGAINSLNNVEEWINDPFGDKLETREYEKLREELNNVHQEVLSNKLICQESNLYRFLMDSVRAYKGALSMWHRYGYNFINFSDVRESICGRKDIADIVSACNTELAELNVL